MVNLWEVKGKLKASTYKLKVLKLLNKEPKTPRDLEKETNIKISHISKTLKDLVKLRLIECKTPNLRQGKYYGILPLGKKLSSMIK